MQLLITNIFPVVSPLSDLQFCFCLLRLHALCLTLSFELSICGTFFTSDLFFARQRVETESTWLIYCRCRQGGGFIKHAQFCTYKLHNKLLKEICCSKWETCIYCDEISNILPAKELLIAEISRKF